MADPFNRPLQQSTVAEYEQRLFDSGLASDCSGPEWAGHILNSMECVTVSVFDLLDVTASELSYFGCWPMLPQVHVWTGRILESCPIPMGQ